MKDRDYIIEQLCDKDIMNNEEAADKATKPDIFAKIKKCVSAESTKSQ